MEGFHVSQAPFLPNADRIRAIRLAVFVEEQGVPVELEMDEMDPFATHVLAWVDERAVGTGRLLGNGHIGRVAVLAPYRRQGIGEGIMQALTRAAKEKGIRQLELSSQVHAVAFYERMGFRKVGGIYVTAGIDHADMRKRL